LTLETKINCEKTNIEGTTNIVNFPAKGSKKLCHISSTTAALGDVISTETIITEERMES
jgi:ssRNA-specific RNase YbeY (16S rRNA maturation enzyme)